ncbi:MAG: hypothetical protein IPQ26_10605 [Elusimicrobia bacterium]|nr:hypothetical protein [Elusimicrobiota bacterium]
MKSVTDAGGAPYAALTYEFWLPPGSRATLTYGMELSPPTPIGRTTE